MPNYKYKAKKGIETVVGSVEADSSQQAIAKLEEMGFLPMKVEPEKKMAGSSQQKLKRIPQKDLSIFTRQLSSMIKSKVQLLHALEVLFNATQNAQLKLVVGHLRDDVKQGKQFSEALAKYPKYFSRIYINMVTTGEKGGILEQILIKLVEFSEREEEIKSKIRNAMAYPAMMAVVGVLSVIVMFTYVMPKLTRLFDDMGQSLPTATKILIGISGFAQAYWYWVLIATALFIILVSKFGIIEKNRIAIDRFLMNLPIVGKSIKNREIARFSRTLSLLLENGIQVRDALSATIPTLGNRALESELKDVSQDLAGGLTVSKSLSKSTLFPAFVLSLISVGEEAGHLDSAFDEIATIYEKELDDEIKVLSSLIEPVMILSIGLVIGFIIVAMLMPIFEMNLG